MTIAASVVVHPSRSLSLSIYAMASMALIAAFLILFGPNELSWVSRLQISAIVSISAVVTVFKAGRYRKTFHIDISGIGQIRLTQYSGVSIPYKNTGMPLDCSSGQLVHLCPDSILWPHLMLLRLKADEGEIFSVPVLHDSLDAADFAQLLVACRWIAAQPPSRKMND